MTEHYKLSRGVYTVLANALLIIFSISCIFPIVWMLISSFKTTGDFNSNVMGLPKAIFAENYRQILFESNIYRYMLNSVIVTAVSVALQLLIGFFIGYFLSRHRFRGRNFIYLFFLVGMLIPIHSQMVPAYIMLNKLGLTDNLLGLILVYIAGGLPLVIFLIESYLGSIPVSLEEAALIDGCSFNQILFRIILPLAVPILVTCAIIQLFSCWNEFSYALIIISKDNLRTIPLGLTLIKGQYANNYPKMMASMLVSMAPVVIIYFSFSRKIINGVIAGAVKG